VQWIEPPVGFSMKAPGLKSPRPGVGRDSLWDKRLRGPQSMKSHLAQVFAQ